MPNDLAAYFSGLRSGELARYHEEIHAHEKAFFESIPSTGPRQRDRSAWVTPRDRAILRSIEDRHGIEEGDPRVYSIASYNHERGLIEAEWAGIGKRRQAIMLADPEADPPYGLDWYWYHARLADCVERRFAGFSVSCDIERVDSVPKLWYWCTFVSDLNHEYLEQDSRYRSSGMGGDQESRSRRRNEQLQSAYRMLHRLKVDWAPSPPYPFLVPPQAVDKLFEIANGLEREEAQRLTALWIGESSLDLTMKTPGVGTSVSEKPHEKIPRPRRGRRSDTDHAEDAKLAAAWKTKRYPSRAALAEAFGMPFNKVVAALDRVRKRDGKNRNV